MTVDPRSLITRMPFAGRPAGESGPAISVGSTLDRIARWFVVDVIDRPSVAAVAAGTVWALIVAAYVVG